ncbi:MAG: peptidylprolyl isomerase [Lachnospiraceae bacterium]|nr:peptidylprolyl isomerase [Lachnospiraceae bacterium]
MAKNTAPEEKAGEQKVMTRYDRKMEERRIQKEKDQKQEKLTKLIASIIGIVLVVILVISIARPIVAKQTALNGTYIQVGSHNISKLEYDYYYNMMLNNNASMLSYYGLDASADLSEYMISEDMSFKDMYDNMAVEQLQQVKAMVDEAQKNGFTYDGDAEYEEYTDSMKSFLEEQGMDIGEYYKEMYGTYATVSNITPFEKETMLANAYYQELIDQNKPAEEEVKAYYEENKTDYDKVDYRSFTFTTGLEADAAEEAVLEAMTKIQADAQAMAESRKGGADFNELCITYASEEAKENYEDPEKDYSLAEGRYRSSITTVMADWLYDDARTQGDIEVLEDADSNRYYVVEFVNRYYDESDDDRIANLLSGEVVTEMVEELTEQNYQISDPKGNLHYLTIPTGEETTEEQPAE